MIKTYPYDTTWQLKASYIEPGEMVSHRFQKRWTGMIIAVTDVGVAVLWSSNLLALGHELDDELCSIFEAPS